MGGPWGTRCSRAPIIFHPRSRPHTQRGKVPVSKQTGILRWRGRWNRIFHRDSATNGWRHNDSAHLYKTNSQSLAHVRLWALLGWMAAAIHLGVFPLWILLLGNKLPLSVPRNSPPPTLWANFTREAFYFFFLKTVHISSRVIICTFTWPHWQNFANIIQLF